MLRKSVLLVAGYVLFAGSSPVRADNLKTADEVIAKYIESIGGRAKIDAVKTVKMTGKMLARGGMEIAMTRMVKRPNRIRVDFTVQGMTGTQAFDGKIGWNFMPFSGKMDPEKMPEEQAKIFKEQADMDGPLVDYKKKGHQVELVGMDDIEGAEVYKLKVSKKNGDVEYYFLDAEYFLPIKVKGKRTFMGTEVEYETTLGDYKEIGGLLMAHSIQQGGGGMGGTISIEKIEVNIPLDDKQFAMPEVKPAEKEAPSKKNDGHTEPDDQSSTPKNTESKKD